MTPYLMPSFILILLIIYKATPLLLNSFFIDFDPRHIRPNPSKTSNSCPCFKSFFQTIFFPVRITFQIGAGFGHFGRIWTDSLFPFFFLFHFLSLLYIYIYIYSYPLKNNNNNNNNIITITITITYEHVNTSVY